MESDDALARLAREFADELRKWWTFTDGQVHTHTWHDREDFIEKALPKLLARLAPAEGDAEVAERILRELYDPGLVLESVWADMHARVQQLLAGRRAERWTEDATAWLIEHPSEPRWLALSVGGGGTGYFWDYESLGAVRFSRKCDAEATATMLGLANFKATEHSWGALRPSPPRETGEGR